MPRVPIRTIYEPRHAVGRASSLAAAVLLALAAAAACGGDESPVTSFIPLPAATPTPTATALAMLTPSPTAAPTPTPAATPTPTPSPSPTPTPAPTPTLALEPATAAQGEVALARLTGVTAERASLDLAGIRLAMVREGDIWWAVVGIGAFFRPGEYVVTAIWDGGRATAGLTVLAADFAREEIEVPPDSSALLLDPGRIEQERQLLAAAHAAFTPQRLWQGHFALPAQGPISDPFGIMRSINGGPYIPHSGTDIVADEGAPVAAANHGRVVLARPLYLFGSSVVIDHGGGVLSGYHHLSQIAVTEGQRVAKGEAIGAVGKTGLVTGPHLHWEVVVHGVRVDPAPWTLREVAP